MKSHQGRFQTKSFSCVLCALPGKIVFLDDFLVVFTVVRPLVWLLDPPLLQALQGTHLV
jgi:hypothetical protein